ncbi:hypothetical protein Ahy_B07g086481 [Arachis hypogaea]|uniref:peroxidase n=1 Tax=Arachis hypogaea TaxID=3818 RepID=A0A444YA60_ARAHY|nr:hypothetical protein Ahy_B07g086481 [Arachis hypogaea]
MGSHSYMKVWILGLIALIGATHAQLELGFYSKSCPNAEKIISHYVNEHIHKVPSLATTLLRVPFHDCFVRVSDCVQGCDGSVLVASTKNNQAEKEAPSNLTLRGKTEHQEQTIATTFSTTNTKQKQKNCRRKKQKNIQILTISVEFEEKKKSLEGDIRVRIRKREEGKERRGDSERRPANGNQRATEAENRGEPTVPALE